MDEIDIFIETLPHMASRIADVIEAVNKLIDKSESIRGLLEADINAFEEWNIEIDEFLDALDDVEGLSEWECLNRI